MNYTINFNEDELIIINSNGESIAWQAVIGLEVHVQLKTRSKIFSGSSIEFGAPPNTQASAIDLGLPGVLPVLNMATLEMAIKFGLAIEATINQRSIFARKNYFYPDLPKGYQISQFEEPIVTDGKLQILTAAQNPKWIKIVRAHLEEDAGKSLHEELHGSTGIDLNRAGTGLLEIVTGPDLASAAEAVSYLKNLLTLVKYLEICDGNLQEGSFRCDANVSVKPKAAPTLGTRVEIKNLNSFKFIEKAINYEITRQIDLLLHHGKVAQETRLYDVAQNITKVMRSKEDSNDYRYFPDPDLLPVRLTTAQIENIRTKLPELAPAKIARFMAEYGLTAYEANLLAATRELANFYEEAVRRSNNPKLLANWIATELLAALNKYDLEIEACPITPAMLAKLIDRIVDQTISGKIAKQVFEIAWQDPKDPDLIIAEQHLTQVSDPSAITEVIKEIIKTFPTQATEYKNGKEKLFGFFVGKVMQASQGKANPELVNELLKKHLN